MNRILICNSDLKEIESIRAVLQTRYAVSSMQSWDRRPIDLKVFDAIVLDTNFTPAKGLDFVMEACSNAHLPILFITLPDDPQSAIESRRIGVFNYLVKTEKLPLVIELAVRDMILTFNDQQELKRTVVALKARVAELEGMPPDKKGAKGPDGRIQADTPSATAQKRKAMFQEIVKRLSSGEINLPAFPSISLQLTRLIEQDADVKVIATLLKKDMTISAKLMSVANSPFYMGIRPSSTVEQAISVLGLRITKDYVDVIVNRALYISSNSKYQPALRDLWQHGVACAHASRLIAELIKLQNPGEVFFMGLLHDIGKLLLLQVVSELDTMEALESPVTKDDLEAFLQQHHGVTGQKLLQVWKLPPEFAIVAQYHDSPDEAPKRSGELFAVHVGNLLAKHSGYGSYVAERDDKELHKTIGSFGLDEAGVTKAQDQLKLLMEQTGLDFS